jgi:hypothetical protein
VKSRRLKIKIEHQRQANKPIYLLHNGSIVCGAFQYHGSKKKEFQEAYSFILHRAYKAPNGNILDVSKSKIWDAPTICDEIIDRKIQATISARKLYKLACETEIREMIQQIRPIFMDAVRLKWKKIFLKAPGDKATPKNPWEIL